MQIGDRLTEIRTIHERAIPECRNVLLAGVRGPVDPEPSLVFLKNAWDYVGDLLAYIDSAESENMKLVEEAEAEIEDLKKELYAAKEETESLRDKYEE